MDNIYIYRNTAIEYLFKNKNICYSGYEEVSKTSDEKTILMLYFLPYKYDEARIINFIDDYKKRIEYIIESNPTKKIFVVSLYNYFYQNFVYNDNNVKDAIESFNKYIVENDKIYSINIEKFYNKYSLEQIFDPKYYYLYNAIINPKYSQEFEKWLSEEIKLKTRTRKKCLILDLDNTLWGGILGEDGIDKLNISGTYPGNCFNDFQQLILNLKNKGIILCSCSKNNYKDVEECFEKRDDLVLKLDDFSINSISWDNKANQISNIAKKLNIGLDSIVFIDDNPTERELIKTQLSDVVVLDFPEHPYLFIEFFKKEFDKYFGINELTSDDIEKSNQYNYKLKSDELKEIIHNEDDFIKELKIKISYQKMNKYNEQRFEQLINKTNQFNLTTKRYDLSNLKDLEQNNNLIYGIKIIDKFGDLGITGLSIIKIEDDTAIIDSFMLSCRILGRKIEYEFLKFIMNKVYESGITKFKASYIKSNKNEQTRNFYDMFGFVVENSNENITNYNYEMIRMFEYDNKYEMEEIR